MKDPISACPGQPPIAAETLAHGELAASPNPRRLTIVDDVSVQVWPLPYSGLPSPPSPSGRLVPFFGAAEGKAGAGYLLDLSTGEVFCVELDGAPSHLEWFSNDETQALVVSSKGAVLVEIPSFAVRTKLAPLELRGPGAYAAEGPSGIVAVGRRGLTTNLTEVVDRAGNMWSIAAAGSLAFAPDGSALAVGGRDETVVWDFRTGETQTFPGGSNVRFSPDGRYLSLVTLYPEWTRVFDLTSGNEVLRLAGAPNCGFDYWTATGEVEMRRAKGAFDQADVVSIPSGERRILPPQARDTPATLEAKRLWGGVASPFVGLGHAVSYMDTNGRVYMQPPLGKGACPYPVEFEIERPPFDD